MGRFNLGGGPGISAKRESFENQWWWGHESLRIFDALPLIVSTAIDAGASPTTVLRSGLVMGKVTASGKWAEYDITQTDGREVARGILEGTVNMLNSTTGAVEDKHGGPHEIIIGGLAMASKLFGLDANARRQLGSRFLFDDEVSGRLWGGSFLREVVKITDYTVVAADNFTEFVLRTATGVFTLPAIGKGYRFKFRSEVNAAMGILSPEGNNIVALNDVAATSATFQTAGQMLGAGAIVYSNAAGDKWIFENRSAGTAAVTLV